MSRVVGKSNACIPNRPPGAMASRSHARPFSDVVSRSFIAAVVSISFALCARCSSTCSRRAGSKRFTSLPELIGVGVGAGDRADERRGEHDLSESRGREVVAEARELLIPDLDRIAVDEV